MTVKYLVQIDRANTLQRKLYFSNLTIGQGLWARTPRAFRVKMNAVKGIKTALITL